MPNLFHLPLGIFRRPGVVDDIVRVPRLVFVGKLCGTTTLDFGARSLEREIRSPGKTLNFLPQLAGHDNDFVEVLVRSGLNQQRGLDHCDAMGIVLVDLRHPAILALHDFGMHDSV